MNEKKAVIRQTARRYQESKKHEKSMILNEFVETTGYHRKYAIHILATWGKEKMKRIEGRLVRIVVGEPRKRKPRKRKPRYGDVVKAVVRKIWCLFDYMCGKRFAVFLRLNLDILATDETLGISGEIQELVRGISSATIDRILKPERKKLELKGRSHTRPGTLLKHQIPIRTFFSWEDRKPGFFELDTVAHDGGRAHGEYCWTLTATDVYSGWVEVRALVNRAHHWVVEQVKSLRTELFFPLHGVDSDNGGEFINHQLLTWCQDHHIVFTRGRSYRKNDNCFVEQKNDLVVRRIVGYHRYDTPEEYAALNDVYRRLCPLVNFFYPSMKLIKKIRVGARVKKVYDSPKTPYQRLLESSVLSDEVKGNMRQAAEGLHLLRLRRSLDKALLHLGRIHAAKYAPPVGSPESVLRRPPPAPSL
jgi:hypothetical protein